MSLLPQGPAGARPALEGEVLASGEAAAAPARGRGARTTGAAGAIRLGQVVADPERQTGPAIFCEAAALRPHVGRPWFRAYAAQRLGKSFGGPPGASAPG